MFKFFKLIFLSIVCIFVMCGALLFGFTDQIVSLVAPKNMEDALVPDAASQIFDAKGRLIYTTLSVERRIPVTFDKINKNMQNAIIAIEDNRFYSHPGIDVRGTTRALISTLSGREVQGGSTITQQLAKNAFTNHERTLTRKIKEAFYSLALEEKYTKQEILCMYLNQIYFGQGAYGLESASRYYFNKSCPNLTLAQAACLAAIPKSPNYFNPFANPKESKQRQELVLDQMVKYGYISQVEADAAKKEDLQLASWNQKKGATPDSYFYDMIVQEVIELFGSDALYKDGLKIYTTLDMDMQEAAVNSLKHLNNYASYVDGKGLTQPQVALAAVEPATGQIKAMIGGRGQDKYNRAYLSARQPGSSFKPFVYVTAMQNGFTPASVIEDKAENFGGGWSPHNSDGQEHGKVSVRTALVRSLNIPTVKIARAVGVEKIVANAESMGITTLVNNGTYNDANLAMSLGGLTKGVNPLEMAAAYAVFANNGTYVKPYAISKILDRDGKLKYEHKTSKRDAIKAREAYLVTNMLQDVLIRGTGAGGGIGRPAAGKTGTTDGYIDAWFVGYTPNLSTAVWVGDDNNKFIQRMYGSGAPLDIWQSFMINALKNSPAPGFTNPGVDVPNEPEIIQDGMTKLLDKNGKPVTDSNGKTIYIKEGTVPVYGADGKPTFDANGKPVVQEKKPDSKNSLAKKISGNKKSLKERIKEATGKPVISNKPVKQN